MQDVLTIALLVEELLDRMGVRHVVGGSLASSLHGIPRATQDIDFVADLRDEHVSELVRGLLPSFYVDEEASREAVRDRTRFNAIHLETMFKVDVYVPERDAALDDQLARGRPYDVHTVHPGRLIVASPEDTIVQKLRWFRLGDEVSERQWRDAAGVIKVQGDRLDAEYLTRAADRLGVGDLLDRVLRETGSQE
ncbi:MAG: hypothetical protein R3195_03655 [Gemmatimonadota bacterium]|nr:hypothetical protein [Gemmatimonadota bacterium]